MLTAFSVNLVIITGVTAKALDKTRTSPKKGVTERIWEPNKCTGLCIGGNPSPIISNIVSVIQLAASLQQQPYWKKCSLGCDGQFGHMFLEQGGKQGSCYKFYPETECNYQCAVNLCEKIGAKVVSIETEGEMRHLKSAMQRDPSLRAKIIPLRWPGYMTSGMYDDTTRKWIWKATEEAITYTNWASLNPYRKPRKHIYLDTRFYQWWNVDDGPRSTLCEKEAVCV